MIIVLINHEMKPIFMCLFIKQPDKIFILNHYLYFCISVIILMIFVPRIP